MENEKDYGIIYVLSNPCMKGIVKIGKTKRNEYQKRMRDLYYGQSGVPKNFVCERAYKVPLHLLDETEKRLHSHFVKKRVNPRREFFRVKPTDVDQLIDFMNLGGLAVEDIAIKGELNSVIDKVTKADEKKSASEEPATSPTPPTHLPVTSEPAKPMKKPNMDFIGMGLKVGQKLVYIADKSITCTIRDSKTVWYNDEKWYLTPLTHLFHPSSIVRPAPYWETEDGTPLTTLYNIYATKVITEKNASDLKELSAELEPIINAKV